MKLKYGVLIILIDVRKGRKSFVFYIDNNSYYRQSRKFFILKQKIMQCISEQYASTYTQYPHTKSFQLFTLYMFHNFIGS